MTAKDQNKLLNAGFTVLRAVTPLTPVQPTEFVIKAKTKARPDWFVLKKDFKSGAEFHRVLDNLLLDKKTVQE